MVTHLRALDAAKGKKGAKLETTAHGREEDARRAALERAAEVHGFRDPDDDPGPASDELDLHLRAADEYHRGSEPGSSFYPATARARDAASQILERAERARAPEPGVRGDLERAAARLGGWSESSQAERPAVGADADSSIRASLEAADRTLNNGGSADVED